MKPKTITRRTLLKNSALAAIGSSLFFNSPLKAFGRVSKVPQFTKVVLIRNKEVLKNGEADKDILKQMIDQAVVELTGAVGTQEAWNKILKPDDILGIKTNAWNNLPTPPQVEEILKNKAIGVGIKENNISINDRSIRTDEVFQNSTALINVRPMRTHAWAGVGSLMKNYIMFLDQPSSIHGDSCADLATLYNLPQTKGKTRLNILVMLTPLFHGIGPHHFNRQYTWEYNGLLLGFDPVAVDSTGLRIIQAKRLDYFGEETPLNPPAKHIMLADTRHHLGTADPEKINLVKMGWDEDLLI
jgi:hypothetical protein